MYELFLLIILIALVVLGISRGKHVVLDNPLVILHPGQYHITLAPQLDRAQTFIEQIAGQFAQSHPPQRDLPSQYFEVHDRSVLAREGSFYLLAASFRGGMLYFQAISPQPLLRDADSHLKQVREFSEAVLALHPLEHPAGVDQVDSLGRAVEMAAQQSNITIKLLTERD
ncbi:MAG: hypothetical protein ABI479_11500 [Gallionella sp.]